MSKAQLTKQFATDAKSGQFSKVLHSIKETKLDTRSSLMLLISVSHACSYEPEKCDLEAIVPFISTIVVYIETLDESQKLKYCQAVYHITRLLCKKKRFEDLAKMKVMILTDFLNVLTYADSQSSGFVYHQIIKQITVATDGLTHDQYETLESHILEIYKFTLQGISRLPNRTHFLDVAQIYANQFCSVKALHKYSFTFYKIILECSTIYTEFSSQEIILEFVIPIFSSIISAYIQLNDYANVEKFIDSVTEVTKFKFEQIYFYSHDMFSTILVLSAKSNEMRINRVKGVYHYFETNFIGLFHQLKYHLDKCLVMMMYYLRNDAMTTWLEVPEDLVIKILNVVIDIGERTLLESMNCKCGCTVERNFFTFCKIGNQMVSILRMYMKQSEKLQDYFFETLEKFMVLLYKLINELKRIDQLKWKNYYNELSTHNYNIVYDLHQGKNIALRQFVLCFLKHSLFFEGLEPAIRPANMQLFCFIFLCEIEYNSNKFMECLGYAALYFLMYERDRDTLFRCFWIKTKMNNKEDLNIQNQTIIDVLNLGHLLHSVYDYHSLLTTEKKIELVLYELKQYKANWESKVAMKAAFSRLLEIAPIPVLSMAIVDVYGDGDVPLHIEMSTLFDTASRNIKTYLDTPLSTGVEEVPWSVISLADAVLHYYIFRLDRSKSIENNLKEMKKAMEVLTRANDNKPIEAEPKDANDEFTIVSAYSNLRLSILCAILPHLDSCLNIITQLTKEKLDSNHVNKIIKLITRIAFEYRLHCFASKSNNAFFLCTDFATKAKNYEAHLFALSFLLEAADVTHCWSKEQMNKGDELVRILKEDNEGVKHDKTIGTYYICISKAFLYEDANRAYEAWNMAHEICSAHTENEFDLMKAELSVILYKLTKNNCHFIEGEHTREPMTFKLHEAFDRVTERMHISTLSVQDFCVAFDTIYEVLKTYHQMRLPRDLRAYGKRVIISTQKLVLPLRCATFLILLAYTDLETGRFNDFSVKRDGIQEIVCPNEQNLSFLGNIEDISNKMRQFSASSPTVLVEGPETLIKRYDLIKGVSFEVDKLFLTILHLNFLACTYEGQDERADGFARAALTHYENVIPRFFKPKGFKDMPNVWTFKSNLLEPYAYMLLDYSFQLYRQMLTDNALKMNTKLLETLKFKHTKYPYLYQEALLQRLSYLLPEEKNQMEENAITETCLIPRIENISLARTPVNKTTKISVTVNGKIPTDISPPKRKGKKCKLFTETNSSLIDESTKENIKDANSSPIIPHSKSKPVMPSTPFFGSLDTPKIKIFTDDEQTTIKTYSKKRLKEPNTEPKIILNKPLPIPVLASSKRKPQNSSPQSKTISIKTTRLKKNITGGLLNSKPRIPATKSQKKVLEPQSSDNSILGESPEHAVPAAKSAALIEKLKISAQKSAVKKTVRSKEIKKNLFTGFVDDNENDSSSSKCAGTVIRKSARNRVI